jgi:hypothetical protein
MKTLLITFFTSLVISNSTYSNVSSDSVNLSDYKYRVANYKGLNIEMDLKNKTSNNFYSNGKYNLYSGNFDAKLNAFIFKSTANYFGATSVNINALPSFSFSNNSSNGNYFDKKKSQSVINYNSIFTNNKFYKSNNYILVNSISTFNYISNFNSNKQNYSGANSNYQSKNNSIQLVENLELGIGKGRLELVTDAATTLFILKDLNKTESKNDISKEKVFALTKAITRLNNTRKFDARMRRIYMLKQLDSTLNSLQLSNKSSIENFTIINDNLYYANQFQRYSGTIKGISLLNGYNFQNSNYNSKYSPINALYDTSFHSKYFSSNVGVKLYLESHKAINLYWQREINASVEFNLNHTKNKNIYQAQTYISNTPKNYSTIYFRFYYSKSYIPNTRTNITAYANLNSMVQKNTKSNFVYYPQIGLGLRMNYWIAPRLQTTLNVEVYQSFYSTNFKNIQTHFNSNLNGGLMYYFY